jgi:hypothetical protein
MILMASLSLLSLGNHRSIALLRTSAMTSKLALSNPPPTSKSVNLNPASRPISNARAAREIASEYAIGS